MKKRYKLIEPENYFWPYFILIGILWFINGFWAGVQYKDGQIDLRTLLGIEWNNADFEYVPCTKGIILIRGKEEPFECIELLNRIELLKLPSEVY